MLVVVKYVVKEILPQFYPTFNGGIYVCLRSNREVCNISGSRTILVFQLPKQARYQLRYTRISKIYYTASGGKMQPKNDEDTVCLFYSGIV